LYPYLFYTKKSLNINYNENFLFYNKLYLILPYNNVEELKAIRNKDFDFENKKNYIKYIELLYDE